VENNSVPTVMLAQIQTVNQVKDLCCRQTILRLINWKVEKGAAVILTQILIVNQVRDLCCS
jgi:hypothetical protein